MALFYLTHLQLSTVLEFRSAEASRLLTKQAQESAKSMRDMTRNMQSIAQKTKQETVSMRVITLVTLLYLPSTFISVSFKPKRRVSGLTTLTQTLMSTDIVNFRNDISGKPERIVRFEAIQLYIAISIPLTFATFVAWYGIYRCVVSQEKKKQSAQPLEGGRCGWLGPQHGRDRLPPV